MDYRLFDSLLDAVVAIDAERRIRYFNPAAESLFNLRKRLLQQNIRLHEVVEFQDPSLFGMKEGERGKEEPTPYRETGFRTSSGLGGTVQVSVIPDRSADREPTAWLVVCRDVTLEESLHRKYMAELERKEHVISELRETREWLIQSSKVATLGQFVAGISHEINNPLAIVIGSTDRMNEILAGGKGAEDIEELRTLARYALNASSRIMKLVEHLRVFIHSPMDRVSFVEADLRAVIQNAMDFTQHLTRKGDVTVRNLVPEGFPKLKIDASTIEQVAINMIRNSFDAMMEAETRGPCIEISAELNEKGREVSVLFRDNGPGIPAKIKEKIFAPFTTTKKMGHGTGLGLSICTSIAERHGGRLEVKSEVGKGATFILSFPVDTGARERIARETRDLVTGREVLIVDDEPDIRRLLAAYLTNAGCRVHEASDGSEVERVMRTNRLDVVITDLVMPKVGGVEVAERIKREHPGVRVVLISGSANVGNLADRSDVFDAYVVKPFHQSQVLAALARALGGGEEAEAA